MIIIIYYYVLLCSVLIFTQCRYDFLPNEGMIFYLIVSIKFYPLLRSLYFEN